jgi:hypothetical protein
VLEKIRCFSTSLCACVSSTIPLFGCFHTGEALPLQAQRAGAYYRMYWYIVMPYASYKYWPGRKLSFAGVGFSEAGQIRALTVALGVG